MKREQKDSLQWTALHEAYESKSKTTVELLFKNGADMTLQDKSQRNALYIASFRGKEDIFHLLLANGTDLFVPGGAYDVALNMACAVNWPDDILVLLDKWPAFEVPPEIYNRATKTKKNNKVIPSKSREAMVQILHAIGAMSKE